VVNKSSALFTRVRKCTLQYKSLTNCSLKTNFNIIFPLVSKRSNQFLPYRFPN
jgi:hypothetical protein